jgi:CRISPR-associated protein Cmr2
MSITPLSRIQIAIAWCLAYSPTQSRSSVLQSLRNHFYQQQPCSADLQLSVNAATNLVSDELAYPRTVTDLQVLIQSNPLLWDSKVGLVYGGATKIKQYVFELPKLQEIRGASALLDNINLVDLPAFFHAETETDSRYFSECQQAREYCTQIREGWLDQDQQLQGLSNALIPELIIYSTGGNILAFCPAALTNSLANAIEKRYTHETLTANSCAVGATFKPLELRLGLLPDQISEQTFWFETYQKAYKNSATQDFISAYIRPTTAQNPTDAELWSAFQQRKSFNEIVSKLAALFNQRRSGNTVDRRPDRRFPPMFESHPYLNRDGSENRSAVLRATPLPGQPWYSEAAARKRLVGQIVKREGSSNAWYRETGLSWRTNRDMRSWVRKFETFLKEPNNRHSYYRNSLENPSEARSLQEIGNACKGFVAYIYADGNNMGGYIQKITTPQAYQKFSQDIFEATERSVYAALATHLQPHRLSGLTDPEHSDRNDEWIHPFEIITIGGDDVMLVVPADQALAIAETLGEQFEAHLAEIEDYRIEGQDNLQEIHRYCHTTAAQSSSCLSMSTGVLITAVTTPIYYAADLTNQLLKSAKERAKQLKGAGYSGGTVDFMALKSVTMISSNIKEFRNSGLVKHFPTQSNGHQTLKLYAAPYTLHELGGLRQATLALKQAEFPRSQLYQIRSLLDRGKRAAMLNYRYFRVRLNQGQQALQQHFEESWCNAQTNPGNLAPWMYHNDPNDPSQSYYETIWQDLVDLYEFTPEAQEDAQAMATEVNQ